MVSQQEYAISELVLRAVLVKEYFFAWCWLKTHHIFIFKVEPILLLQPLLIKKGAEADIYIVEWDSKKAVSKVRSPKSYRHPELDSIIRKHRTIHEASFMSAAKSAGVMSPFSNFVINKRLVLLDFGLSYYSERTEDMATDIRLIKEVFTSAHIAVRKAFPRFVEGYASVAGRKRTDKILVNVRKIEQRGRYARMT